MSEKIEPVANRRILVVDDNAAIHQDFQKILCPIASVSGEVDSAAASLFGETTEEVEASSFQLTSAYQGKDALKLVEESMTEGRPYAVAFIDVRMPPGWDGIETTSRLWKVDPHLQVVICTAYSDYSWDKMIAVLGRSPRLVILKKPFDNIEVIQMTNALAMKWQLEQQMLQELRTLDRLVADRTSELELANKLLREESRRAVDSADAALAGSKAKDEFLATMSHEIRTPMNGILGFSNLLLGTQLTEEQREYAEAVRISADSLLVVLNDILDISRIEAGKLVLETIDFDFRETIRSAVQLLQERAKVKGIALTFEVDAAVPGLVRGDPHRLRQILLNLLNNAVKFTEKGRVSLRATVQTTSEDSVRVRCEVIDTGIGLSKENQTKLFQPFVQADSSVNRKFGGSGLGLAISRRLVELMDGSIGVESQPGSGSTFWFTIWLRRVSTSSAVPVALPPPRPVPVRVTSDGRRPRILLGEDQRMNQRLATAQLNTLGCDVTVADNGLAVIEAWKREPFDAILMDWSMPELDGMEATRILRKLQTDLGRPHIPIIALTANAMTGDRDACLSAGMDDYVSKPVRMADLRACLDRYLFPPATRSEPDPPRAHANASDRPNDY